jgi:hypothetical protein
MGFMFSRPVGSSESNKIRAILEQISITDTTSPIFRMLQQIREKQKLKSSGSGSDDPDNDILMAYSLRDLASQSLFTFKRQGAKEFYAVKPLIESQKEQWKKHQYLRSLDNDEMKRVHRVYQLLIIIMGITSLITLDYVSAGQYTKLSSEVNQTNHHLYKLFKYFRTPGPSASQVKTTSEGGAKEAKEAKPKKDFSGVDMGYPRYIAEYAKLFDEAKTRLGTETTETLFRIPKDILQNLRTSGDSFESYYRLKKIDIRGIHRGEHQEERYAMQSGDSHWLTFLETIYTLDTLGFCSSDKRYQTMIESFAGGSTTDLGVYITDFIGDIYGYDDSEFSKFYENIRRAFAVYIQNDELLTSQDMASLKPLRELFAKPFQVLRSKVSERCSGNNRILNARMRSGSGSVIESPFVEPTANTAKDSSKVDKIKMSSRHFSLVKEYHSMIMKLRANIIREFYKVFVVDSSYEKYRVVFSFEEAGKDKDKPAKKFLCLKNEITSSNQPETILLGVLSAMLTDMFATQGMMLRRMYQLLQKDLIVVSKEYLKKPENAYRFASTGTGGVSHYDFD